MSDIRMVICAAPDYLQRRGEPVTPKDLAAHDCLGFSDVPGAAEWSFQVGAARKALRVPARLCANDFEVLSRAALAGAGIIRAPDWLVDPFLADGRLRVVLEAYQRPPVPLHVVALRSRLRLPKLRAFVTFLQMRWGSG